MENSGDKKKFKFVCPYCTKEIAWGTKECSWCGTSFGINTLRILKSAVQDVMKEEIDERRRDDRVPKKFKITYSSPQVFVNSYLFNISVGGIFIKTDRPMERGTLFDLKISLPDGEKELDVSCEVAWTRTEEGIPSKKNVPSGMGVKFLNLSPEGRQRIDRILHQAKA